MQVNSNPILVEGVCYRLRLYPDGLRDGRGTHLSVAIWRTKPYGVKLVTNDEVWTCKTLIHSTDESKNFTEELVNDWTGKNDQGFASVKFFKIDDLAKDGFIHPDGSLKFRF